MRGGTAGDKGRAAAGRAAALCGELQGGRGRRSSSRGPRGGRGAAEGTVLSPVPPVSLRNAAIPQTPGTFSLI